jgi:nucleotide-binding universal stress UspA family protein
MLFNKLLAATDFSASAEQAVRRAALLAKQHDATLHLMHVVPTLTWTMFGRALVEHPLVAEKNLFLAAKERLSNLAEDCADRYGIAVQSHVDIGRPYQRIAEYVTTHGIDMAVLGPHADNPVRDVFIGSTASRFVRRGAPSAQMVCSASADHYRRMLVAVDFSDASRLSMEAAASLAPEAVIHILHVFDVLFEGKMLYANVGPEVIQQYRDGAEAEAWRMMNEFTNELALPGSVLPVVRSGNPAQRIIEEAQTQQADLNVMGKRARSELDQLYLGSVTENVLHKTDRDLLLVAQ